MNRKVVWSVVVIAVIIVALAFIVNKPNSSSTVKIGVIAPLTGWAAYWGEDAKRGIDLAVDEINKTGGIAGKPITVIFEDFGELNLAAAASAANKLVNADNVDVLVTNFLEDTTVASPIAHKGDTPIVSVGAGNNGVEPKEMLFRMRPYVESVFPEVSAEYFMSKGYKNPVVIFEQIQYYINFKDETVNVWKKLTGKEPQTIAVVGDGRDALAKAKQGQYDLIYIRATSPTQIELMKQIKEMGIKAPVEGTEAHYPEFISAGKITDGLIYTNYKAASSVTFAKDFKDKYGVEAGIPGALAYDVIYAIKNAIKDGNLDSESLVSGLKSVKFEGASGPVQFDSNQNRVIDKSRAELLVKENGVFVPLNK